MSWRRPLVTLHRDLGFFALGLTVVYAVSGLATNHRAHWDYNYSTDLRRIEVGGPAQLLGDTADGAPAGELARARQDELVQAIGRALGRSEGPQKAFWRGPDRLSLFYAESERDVVDYLPASGVAEWTRKSPRPILRTFNMLHLNEKRQVWTWIGDGYALILLFMGVSGALIVKGRKGLVGRGGMYVVAGILIPALAMILLG